MLTNAQFRIFIGACLFLAPPPVLADINTFYFTGVVTTVDPALTSEFSIGESVVGNYTFDTTAPDHFSDPRTGFYEAIESFTSTFGGDFTMSLGSDNLTVVVNSTFPRIDTYAVDIDDPVAQAVSGINLSEFEIQLSDIDGDIFDTIDLPLTPPDLTEIEADNSHLRFRDNESNFFDVTFVLTSFQPNPIPEPATVLLDIKPDNDDNLVNLDSSGVLPVAVFATEEFDVVDINVATILFGDPLFVYQGGAATAPLQYAYEDITGDGLVDLTLEFSIPDLVDNYSLRLNSFQGLLTGELHDGTPITGIDSIQIIPEPTALTLVVVGLLGLYSHYRKRA